MLFLNKNYKLFFSFLCLLIFYRSPYIFLNGRFIAEEGQWWFNNVFINGSLSVLHIFIGEVIIIILGKYFSVVTVYFHRIRPLGTVYMALFESCIY